MPDNGNDLLKALEARLGEVDDTIAKTLGPLRAQRAVLQGLRTSLINARKEVDDELVKVNRLLSPFDPKDPPKKKATANNGNSNSSRGFTDQALRVGSAHILGIFDHKEEVDELPFITISETLEQAPSGYHKANAYKIFAYLREHEVIGISGQEGNTKQFRLMDRRALEQLAVELVEAN